MSYMDGVVHDKHIQDGGREWMPVEEYASLHFVKKNESFDRIAKICMGKKDNKYVGFTALPTSTATSAKKSYLYSNYQGHLSDS
ncbi:hypothetical protein Ccrd_017932 [Cynara cardunculus var. scolymus]|uniref:Uncharacterized protein n=1 Tax=Cynara cardunculus var. scolymus TaxID=59895 RepID=A0A103Y762_CYNCS|nr:hypothetical protein Ccrd_017932 [Cynara cardunculus var. scolymus]